MPTCSKCEDLPPEFDSHVPERYRNLVLELIGKVNAGALIPLYASCPLEEILGPVWPGDVLVHDFRCAGCGKLYRLHADTYHGDVSWEGVDASETTPFQSLRKHS